jgi:hypothetical protein
MAESISGLVDAELSALESMKDGKERIYFMAERLPALISAVNMIGYLRGQDGMFLDFLPMDFITADIQSPLAINELAFEKRLDALLTEVGKSEQRENFRERLERYYIQARAK